MSRARRDATKIRIMVMKRSRQVDVFDADGLENEDALQSLLDQLDPHERVLTTHVLDTVIIPWASRFCARGTDAINNGLRKHVDTDCTVEFMPHARY